MEEPTEDKWDACGIKTKCPSYSFGVHGGFLWRKNTGTDDSPRRGQGWEWACSAQGLATVGLSGILGQPGRSVELFPHGQTELSPGLCLYLLSRMCSMSLLPFPPGCARSWAPSIVQIVPSLLLLCCCWPMNLELEKRKLELFFLFCSKLLPGFYTFSLSLCICRLAGLLLFAWMSPWAASQSASLNSGKRRAGSIPTQPLPPAPVCGWLTVVPLELQSAELFEEVAKKAASVSSLQVVGVRHPESAFPWNTSQGVPRQAILRWWTGR